jgi:hypothetical protein
LSPIAGTKSLEAVAVGILQVNTVDLSPLAQLPRLREIVLMGYNAFDLTALRGKTDLAIRVPADSALIGAEELGPGSSVAEFTFPPRLCVDAAEEG